MQRKTFIVLCQGIITVALWACGFTLLQSPAQAGQAVQDETTEKAKKPHKSKKAAVDTATPAPAADTVTKATKAPAPTKNASEAEIQSAKSGGKVWVNTETGVYHKGGKWFGATKQGKFMTEQEATKAGYRAAKNEK